MTTFFNYDPYYDDFEEDKNYMRVLFRPGYSVQARELTQLQTILSNQIEKFGNHIFQNGSPITGGKISLDDRCFYLILDSQYNNQDIDVNQFLDKNVISFNSGKQVRAKVISVDNTTGSPVLVLKYLSAETFAESDEIRILGQNIFAKAKSTSAVGRSYVASIQEGVYYFKGNFVKVVDQFLVLELFYRLGYNSNSVSIQPSYKIGIEFEENIVDEISDTTLLDPAQGAFNYQAPGASRYEIKTRLAKRTLDSSDESSFFEVIRIVNGVKTKEINYPLYSEIEKSLARRTYEESGNYTVDPFVLTLEEESYDANNNLDPNSFTVVLDPGKAYVGGHEVQTIAPTRLSVPRSRLTSNVSDYDLPTNFSSYIAVANTYGTLDISAFPKLDIHCTSLGTINAASVNEYNSTKIGTLRADMIEYDTSFDFNNGTSHIFRVNVFDVSSTPIVGTMPAGLSTNTVIELESSFSTTAQANCYANMYFRITDGTGAFLAPILISQSNSIAQTITLSQALPFVPSANTYSIESDFKVAESISVKSGASLSFAANLHGSSKDAGTGYAFITEPSKTSLIFDTPFESIKEGSIENFDFYAKKVYADKLADSGGALTISTTGTDTFAFAGSPGLLSDAQILDNIICFIRYNSTTNPATGILPNTIVSLANSAFTVTAISDTSISVDFNTAGVRADFIITTKVNNAENGTSGAIRGKQLVPLTTGPNLHEKVPYNLDTAGNSLSSGNTGTVTTITGGYVFEDVGATFFNSVSLMQQLKTPGTAVSLQVPDVYEIVRITDSRGTGNVTTAMLTDPIYDVTSHYEFDNGQRKTHYDHATIKLKRGYSSPIGGTVLVQYKYLRHQAAPSPQNIGLFTVDSYLKAGSNFTYGEMSKFLSNEDGKLISLRSCLDFRPTRQIASDTISGAVNPDPNYTAELSFEHYLNRIDKIVVKPSKEFAVVSGKSSVTPIPPPIDSTDMLTYTLTIPAYTESVKEINAEYKNNRRFTMNDIGSFEKRIKGLEYYVALSSLEKNAADSKILDADGLERSKFGILVDNFTTRDVQATYSDVGFDNRNLIEEGELKPASLMRTFKLKWSEANSSGSFAAVGVNNQKSLMLSYANTAFASQPYATKSIPIASALFANFKGSVRLIPEFTSDVDTGHTAKVTINAAQGLENAFNFVNESFKFISDQNPTWVNDKDNPFAKVVDSKWFETVTTVDNRTVSLGGNAFGNLQTTTDRVYVQKGAELNQKQISTSTTEVDVGTFITDLAIQPYLKPRDITFIASALKPNARFYAFFDDVSVDEYIVVPNKIQVTSGVYSNTIFVSGEIALIANNGTDLAFNIASYTSGGTNFDATIISSSERGSSNVSIINETGKSLSGKIIYGMESKSVYAISSVLDHHSGLTRGVTSTTITLAEDAPSVNIAGNTISLVHKTGIKEGYGKEYTVIGYNTSTKVATLSGTTTAEEQSTSSWTYSLGYNSANKLGDVSGVFYPPAATFRNGERNFRLTESVNNSYDADAISFGEKTFVSSGIKVDKTNLLNTVYNVDVGVKFVGNATSPLLQSTTNRSEITATWRVDPMAQTFFVDPEVYPNGLFVENVKLFFSRKDEANLPVSIQIRPTVNALPSADFAYPESFVTKYPFEVNVSSAPDFASPSSQTKFTFNSPVFLTPGLYAIVVLTDSPDYSLWVAEKGGTTLNNQYVSVNPYVGTLYKSQNAMEYVPYLNEDIMFNMDRCVFTTSPATFILESESQPNKYYLDKFRLIQKSLSTQSNSPFVTDYKFISKVANGSKETFFRDMLPFVTYSMGDDDLYVVGSRRKEIQNQGDFTASLTISSTDNAVSPLISLESIFLNGWENFVDNAEVTLDDFNIIASGGGYSNSNVVTITSNTGTGALVYLVTNGASGNVVGLNVASSGSGYYDDFTISIPGTGQGAITSNASIVLNSEYDSTGGITLAKYITKPITLADGFDAGDLRLFLSANKPSTTEIHVYYKVLSGSDATPFKDRPYLKMECLNPTIAASTKTEDFREYEYRPSLTNDTITYSIGNGATFDSFKTFAIKIVMTSADPSVVPKVKDLRVIALPGG
jgi:hypothetical protein